MKTTAQDVTVIYPDDTTRMIPDYMNLIVISNTSGEEIVLKLSSDKKRWIDVDFKKVETKLFALGSTIDKCYCIITTTDNNLSKRILHKKHKYQIFWDDKFKKWDIKEL